jgi:hypothetical protein
VCRGNRSLNGGHLTGLMSRDLAIPEGMVRLGEDPIQRDLPKNNRLPQFGGVY